MSIELRNEIASLKGRVETLEQMVKQLYADVHPSPVALADQVHKDQARINIPPEIARATLTLPEKRKSA